MPETIASLLVAVQLDMSALTRDLNRVPQVAAATLASGMEQAQRQATAAVVTATREQARAQAQAAREAESAVRAQVAAQNRQHRDETAFLKAQIAEQESARRAQIAAEQRQWRDETAFFKAQLAEQAAAERQAQRAQRDESSLPQRTTGQSRRMLANRVGASLESVGVGVLGALGFAAEQAAKFQTVLTDMRTNTQMTDGEFNAFSKTALQLGENLGASTEKVADSFRVVKDFGYSQADSIRIVTEATRSAVATNSDASVTTEFLAQTLHSFHDPASKAGEDMNLLHQAALKGHASMEQFVQSARDGFAIAGGFGQSLKDTAAVYAALTLNGFNAAEATTQLRNLLQHIANPSRAAQAEIEKLARTTGVDLTADFTAAGLAAKGLPGVLQDVEAATRGNTAEAFKLINAQRGGFGAFLLAGKGADDLRGILANLSDVTGGRLDPITQGLNQRMGTLQNQVERMNNRFLEMYTKVAPAVLPFLERLIDSVSSLLDRFNALDPGMQDRIVKMVAWGGAVSVAGGFMLKLATGVREFAEMVTAAKLLQSLNGIRAALTAEVGAGTVGAALMGGGAAAGGARAAAGGAAAMTGEEWLAGGAAGAGGAGLLARLGGGLSRVAGGLGVGAAVADVAAVPLMLMDVSRRRQEQAAAEAQSQVLKPFVNTMMPKLEHIERMKAELRRHVNDPALRAEIAAAEADYRRSLALFGRAPQAPDAAGGEDDPQSRARRFAAAAAAAERERAQAAAEKAAQEHHKRLETEERRFHDAVTAARGRLADVRGGGESPQARLAAQFPEISAARVRELAQIDAEITKVREARRAHEEYSKALGEVYAKIRDARQGPKSDAAQLREKLPGASAAEIAQLVAAQQTLRGIEAAHKAAAAAAESNRAAHKRLSDQIVSVRKELTVHKNETDLDRLSQEFFGRAFGTLTAATQAQVRALASEDAALAANTAATEAAAKAKAELESTRANIAAQIRDDQLQVQLESLNLDQNSIAYRENALSIQNWHRMFADLSGEDARQIERLAQLTQSLNGVTAAAQQASAALAGEMNQTFGGSAGPNPYESVRESLNLGGAPRLLASWTVPNTQANGAGGASAGGSASMTAPINIHMTVHATDANSFRRSQPQIMQDAYNAGLAAQRRNG